MQQLLQAVVVASEALAPALQRPRPPQQLAASALQGQQDSVQNPALALPLLLAALVRAEVSAPALRQEAVAALVPQPPPASVPAAVVALA